MGSNGKNNGSSLDDQLAAIEAEGSRQTVEPFGGGDWCRMQLAVPRQFIDDLSEKDCFDFLRTDGARTLMKAILASRAVSVPRADFSGGVDCRVDHAGRVDCHGSVSIRF